MYVVGRFGHVPKLAEIAVHGTEAVVAGAGVASAIKIVAGRARPYATRDTNPRDFGFLRGRKADSLKAFPSGHATAAFSAAAAVVAETNEAWPQYTWIVAPVMFGGATAVGLSRMYDDQHWASDVLMGAAIGTFAGLKVVRFNHTHAGNQLDKILLGTRVVPTANGTALAWNVGF
jgi:membrane-associated phospholipid phosphatase